MTSRLNTYVGLAAVRKVPIADHVVHVSLIRVTLFEPVNGRAGKTNRVVVADHFGCVRCNTAEIHKDGKE